MSIRVHPWLKTPSVKIRLIANSRSGAAARVLPRVRAFAHARDASLVLTERPGHAAELARRALDEGCGLVVAVGGDGTMNEVASVLTGTSALLGLVPCGSGNGLARTLGLHGSLTAAFHALDRGRPRSIDTGLAAGRPFFVAAGFGFEAEICARFNRGGRRGLAGYLAQSAGLWHRHRPEKYHVGHDGVREARRAFTLTVANCDQFGNGARIAPGALPDDGLLDLTAIPPVTAFNSAPLLARLFLGSLGHRHDVLRLRGTRFTIGRAAPGLLHVDGEAFAGPAEVEFEIRPRSLRVLVPPDDELELIPLAPVPA